MPQSESKTCQNCKSEFTIDAGDFEFYKKMDVPAPKLCPDCRFIRRALFRNERTLYKDECALCGESMISAYNPSSPYTVYCYDCYRSDKWDARDYAMEYDSGKPFFEQLQELFLKTPKSAIYSDNTGVNSEYTNFAGHNKNCYLIFNSGYNEDSMYSRGIASSKEAVDAYFCNNVERMYEGVNVQKGSGVVYSQHSMGDIDSGFMLNTSGCQNCFGCVNLRHGSNQFFNEQLDKEEYEQRLSKISGSYSSVEETKKRFSEHSLQFPRRESANLKTVGSIGNYLYECKNAKYSFESFECEDVKYCHFVKFLKDSYDALGFGYGAELILEAVAVGQKSQKVISSYNTASSTEVSYSSNLSSCNNCFGCEGLKNTEYSLLNKKYSEKEYNELKEKIISELKEAGEYGLFFPPNLSPFGYNETVAQENFPLTKEEAENKGYAWADDLQKTVGKETVKPEELPDHINDTPDSIVDEILKCVSCDRNYKIIPAELQFYRKMILPIPRKCFNCRHLERLERRGPMKIFDRTCDNCEKNIKTSYAPDRPEIVYCQDCYQSEVL